MNHSTLLALLLANPFAQQHPELVRLLADHAALLGQLLTAFLARETTPQATADLEHELAQRLRHCGRALLEWTTNHIEPADANALPPRLVDQGQTYRRRGCHPHTVATLFGTICLQRYLYEPLEPGNRCIHPLQRHLGLVADYATPALAQRLAQYAVSQPQRAVLNTLQRDHNVTCSPATLRKVVGAVAAGLEPHGLSARTDRVLALLAQAQASRGKQRVVLAVGRDGIQVPVVGSTYHEASTATVTVFDRCGRRLGTVYLGCMPEAQQATLSQQLTALLREVLQRWDKTRPRLAYITDGGWHPSDYFAGVLRSMADPRQPGTRLAWERIVDFYHAAQYVTQLAEALFGATARARAWARQMRQRLKEPRGVTRLLQAASWHRGGLRLSAARMEAYRKAYQYLSGHRRWMDYARYRRQGLPIGSGITEAGCKVLFTQRLKQSGMKWKAPGGQVIVTLRALWLSGVWDQAFRAFHAAQLPQFMRSTATRCVEDQEKAA